MVGPVTDKVSSFAYLCIDLGAIVGTVSGDLSYNVFGFRRMVLQFAVAHVVVMTVYIVFGKRGCSRSSNGVIKGVTPEQAPIPSSERKLEI